MSTVQQQERNDIDSDLLKRIGRRDEEALQIFFDRYSDDIYNFPIRFFRFSEDEAGDFYLYAFEHLKDGRRLSSFKGMARFSTWFYSVLRNLTLDFLRAKKEEVKTYSLISYDRNGTQQDAVQNIAETDLAEMNLYEDELFENLEKSLYDLKIGERTLFKLSYIHYLELDKDEIDYIQKQSGLSKSEIMKEIITMMEAGRRKSNEVKEIEEKMTQNFQNILQLENRLNLFFKEHPSLPNDQRNWREDYEHSDIPFKITALIQSLVKKKNKHLGLIEQHRRSLLAIRIPYKDISRLLGSTQGVLSVQLMRIIEKLNKTVSV